MDKITALEKAKVYTKLAVELLQPVKVFLYGSFANGNWHEYSDIDIAFVVKKLDNGYLETLTMLYNLTWQVDNIIEPSLFIEGKDSSGFLEYIEKYGELLYKEN